MSAQLWPESLFELMFIPHIDDRLDDLAGLAEPEEWAYHNTPSDHSRPILYNYLHYTYRRLAEETKIGISDDAQMIAFNTGLVTPNQEPLYALANHNHLPEARQPWHFQTWFRRGEHEATRFSQLPQMAHYFDDPLRWSLTREEKCAATLSILSPRTKSDSLNPIAIWMTTPFKRS